MSTRNWTLGSIGRTVAALVAMVAVTACDPYLKANAAAPIVGRRHRPRTSNFNGVAPADVSRVRASPYPDPDPGLGRRHLSRQPAVPGAYATVCPVTCFPPRRVRGSPRTTWATWAPATRPTPPLSTVHLRASHGVHC